MTEDDSIDRESLTSNTVAKLREICKKRGLLVSGKKSELVDRILEDAGAEFLPNSCGICAGYGSDRLLEDQVCLSSTARNFKGRMGDPSSKVYLASPYTVAASAIAGTMVDPRDMMES